jgi:hypothetical protein
VEKGLNKIDLFHLADGTECEPKRHVPEDECVTYGCYIPDVFLEYKGVQFAIGMDDKLWIREDNVWRRA